MCRYMDHLYKTHWACTPCRVTFKSLWKMTCPHCRQPMINMGLDFAAPRKADKKAWDELHRRALRAVRRGSPPMFQGCGC